MQDVGSLAGIALRERTFAELREAASAEVTEAGLEGDSRSRGSTDERRIVLLFRSQWREACDQLGAALPWTARRANLLVDGLPNPGVRRRRIWIGDLLLEVTGECDPCSRMDGVHPGLRAALAPGLRGGLTCRVRCGGSIRVGDSVRLDSARMRDVLGFWFDEVAPQDRFRGGDDVDETVRRRFAGLRAQAVAGHVDDWLATAEGALALLVLLDQFSRNLFRADGRAYEADGKARAIADEALERGHDLAVGADRRLFFYLPWMHSEDLADQDRCLSLLRERLAEGEVSRRHAEKHREVIERFGRFPHRNPALGRESTADEIAYLEAGGYAP